MWLALFFQVVTNNIKAKLVTSCWAQRHCPHKVGLDDLDENIRDLNGGSCDALDWYWIAKCVLIPHKAYIGLWVLWKLTWVSIVTTLALSGYNTDVSSASLLVVTKNLGEGDWI